MKPKSLLEQRIIKMVENEQFREFMINSLKQFNFKNITNEFLVDIIMMNPNIYLKPPFMLVKMKILWTDIDFTDCIKKYELEGNKKVIFNSIKKNGINLKLANTTFRNDKKLVKLALENNGLAIEYASNKLKNDIEMVNIAINNNPDSYYKVPEKLKNNREVIKTLLIRDPSLIDNFSYLDKFSILVKEVIRNNGIALKYANDKLKETKTVVLSAARENLKSLLYASVELLKDQDFLIDVSKKTKSDQVIYYAHSSLQNNKDFIIRLIKETNLNLYLINDSLKDDIDIVNAALSRDTRNLIHASTRIRNNKTLILEYIKKYGNVLNYVNKSLLKDEDFMISAIREYNGCIKNNIINDKEFLEKISNINDWCKDYIKTKEN